MKEQLTRWFLPLIPIFVLALQLNSLKAAEIAELKDENRSPLPETFGPSEEGLQAIGRFELKPGFNVTQVAAEPMLGNVVAFAIDNDGSFYTSETYRYRSSVLDIRHYMAWLEDDLALRNVEERVAMLQKHLGDKAEELAIETEVIRKIIDKDGDGVADSSQIFADGFDTILDGIASGVLPHNGKVYFTNIPSVWVLQDADGDHFAESREELSHGYGVRFSLTGHDLHGLIVGPDGRLYFSCGDRGSHVVTREGLVLDIPDEGGVFRCELDGSKLELFATGLRNPQELAFDAHGNLFTGDNDADLGDRERLVYIMKGSDSGWRVGYQHHPISSGGPWNSELLWKPHFEGRAAYVLPPIANIENGPSGLVYNYGTGLPKEYDGAFLSCHFNGTTTRSGIVAYKVSANGAGFDLIENTDSNGNSVYDKIVWNCLPTDVDFGPDGALYWTDWNAGWPKSNKGRIYRLAHEDELQSPLVAETHALLSSGFQSLESDKLLELLGHQNMKIRLGAQWELADRGHKELKGLRTVAYESHNLYARLHAIWGAGQIARKTPYILSDFLALKSDPEPEVKVQLARIIADADYHIGYLALESMLSDSDARVKSIASIAIGDLGHSKAVSKLQDIVVKNADGDPWLRHGVVMGMAGSASDKVLVKGVDETSPQSLQLSTVLALRYQKSPEVRRFLDDAVNRPLVAAEAARAINDLPINDAMQELANSLKQAEQLSTLAPLYKPEGRQDPDSKFRNYVEPVIIRGLNAAYRLGGAQNANSIAKIAANSNIRMSLRVHAINTLGDWQIKGAKGSRRDRVVGIFRPILTSTTSGDKNEVFERSPDVAATALASISSTISNSTSDPFVTAFANAAAKLNAESLAPNLVEIVTSSGLSGSTRAAALEALDNFGGGQLFKALDYAIKASDDTLKESALRILPKINSVKAMTLVRETLNKGSIGEKQAAYESLSLFDNKESGSILKDALDKLTKGTLEGEVQLEVINAMAKSKQQDVLDALAKYQASLNQADWKQTHGAALRGGNAERGEIVFRQNQAIQCQRCHVVHELGGEVGPVLDGIGSKYTREQILESIAEPNKTIAEGFETLIITTIDGDFRSGTIVKETPTILTINDPAEGPVDIEIANIEERTKGPSGMPPMLHHAISKSELRDLVEFLSSLK